MTGRTFAVLTETQGALAFAPPKRRIPKERRTCKRGDCGGRCCSCRNRKAWAVG